MKDETGKQLALGHLDDGEVNGNDSCTFRFTVSVPDSPEYIGQVADRKPEQFTRTEFLSGVQLPGS